jgi:hypothetical protein
MMMRTMPALSLVLVLATGCAGPARGGEEHSTPPQREETSMPTVALTPTAPVAAAGEEHVATAEPSPGGIVVRGALPAPTPCHTLAATVEDAGPIVLRIAVTADPDAMCAQVIASLGYEAVVGGLPAGEHRLRVVHAYPGSGWDEHTALEATVTVR